MGILAYLVAGIALVGALVGGYMKIHGDGVTQGKAEVQTLWDAANRKAADLEAKRLADADLTARTAAAELAAAQQKASTYQAKWTTERKRHADNTLAGCSPSLPDAATGAPGTLTLKLSTSFVQLWDSAWTNDAGESVFGDHPPAAGDTANPPDTLTAIGPGEVLDNHSANAALCSADRQKLDALIGQIEALRAGWH